MAQQVDPAAWVTAVMQVRSLPENFHMPWAQPKKKEKKKKKVNLGVLSGMERECH